MKILFGQGWIAITDFLCTSKKLSAFNEALAIDNQIVCTGLMYDKTKMDYFEEAEWFQKISGVVIMGDTWLFRLIFQFLGEFESLTKPCCQA
jgi:hypothetical protein